MTTQPTKLNFRLLTPDAKLPQRAHSDDAGYDIASIEETTLAPGERALVRTGIAIELPPQWFAWVTPRSGLAAKHGVSIVNSPGLIDPGFRGEIKVVLINLDRETSFGVTAGMRIAQLVIGSIITPEVQSVDKLSETTRGVLGFGSSGS